MNIDLELTEEETQQLKQCLLVGGATSLTISSLFFLYKYDALAAVGGLLTQGNGSANTENIGEIAVVPFGTSYDDALIKLETAINKLMKYGLTNLADFISEAELILFNLDRKTAKEVLETFILTVKRMSSEGLIVNEIAIAAVSCLNRLLTFFS